MRSHIQNIVDELLDAVQPAGRMDAIQDFAYPLPAIVIAQLLGVPPEDRNQFTQWTASFGLLLGGNELSIEAVIQALYGVAEFTEYFRKIIAQRRTTPKDDLMQAMITAEEQGDRLTEEELLGNCVLLLAAGHGTTTHLIGNGLVALLQNPNQLQALRDDPSMISLAILELLRYDSPVQLTSRHASEDLEIGDKHIGAGQEVFLCLGAANRDPEQFTEPDRLNLRRQENRHLAFGQGIHYCLGAPLARLEAEIAFNTLLRRLQHMRLETTELVRSQSLVFRGIRSLPITFA
jgi:cytochrome P450